MQVKELIKRLNELDPDKEIMICAREENTNPLYEFNNYHKGNITDITFHFSEDLTAGCYMIEADNTFIEYVRT